MRFRGIPREMEVGCVEVRLRATTMLPLKPCGFCRNLHVEYFLCDLGHVTCRDCGTDELEKVRNGKVVAACFGCGTGMPLTRYQIDLDSLRKESMLCPCGFDGTLSEIRIHLREAKYLNGCVLMDKTMEELELNQFKKSFFDLQDVREIIERAEDNLAPIFTEQLAKTEADLDDFTKTEENTATCQIKVESIKAILREVTAMNTELLPTLEAIFRKDGWLLVKLADVVTNPQNTFRAVICGTPLGICTRHETFNGEIWVGIFMRGCRFETERIPQRQEAYPLKAKVGVRLHDQEGFPVAEHDFVTFKKGTYLSPSFKDPTVENSVYVGVPLFASLSDLRNPGIAVNGYLCFSFRFDPLYEIR